MPDKRSPEEAFGNEDADRQIRRRKRNKSNKRRPEKHPKPAPNNATPSSPPNFAAPKIENQLQVSKQTPPHTAFQKKKKSSRRGLGRSYGFSKSNKDVAETRGAAAKGWSLSTGTGGTFINQDPILTDDQKFLILPTASLVQIYSTASSLLIRSLDVGEDHFITSCRLDPSNPAALFVSSSRGFLQKWEWETGRKIGEWRWRRYPVWILHVLGVIDGHGDQVLLLDYTAEGQSQVSRCSLDHGTEEPCSVRTVLSSGTPILPESRISSGAEFFALCSGDKLLLGQQDQTLPNSSVSPYTWRAVTVPGKIMSMDTKFRQEKTKHGVFRTAVDVVVGFQDGVILIYEDLLYRLMGKERGSKTPDIVSRRLHWHRDVVKTVKWSQDGNYLVSGGLETVLVIWQLDTNQRQFLPHLSTAILNITVSASGSSYAIRLADNSVMVLSTADLTPFANISCLSVSDAMISGIPAVFHPRNLNQLVAAIPRTSAPGLHRNESTNNTLVQTFDIGTGLEISRQALTRNVTTTVNVAPTGHQVAEPSVVFLEIGHDGQWLVTVDEWTPPDADINPMYPIGDYARSMRQPRETCLRFWHWSEDGRIWELVTRADEPHSKTAVVGLAFNPIRQEVATVGTDGVLRIWTPKLRTRSGVQVKDRFGEQLQTWTCSIASKVETDFPEIESHEKKSAAATYSEDGSVIAVSWSRVSRNKRLVHFIDSDSGLLRLSQPNLVNGKKAEIAFLRRYLLCLSGNFCIWDTVNSDLVFTLELTDIFKSTDFAGFLAVSELNNTFALAFNSVLDRTAQVAIFGIQRLTEGPISQIHVPSPIKLLLSQQTGPGFVVVDVQNRVRQISPPGSSGTSKSIMAQREEVTNSLDNIFGSRARAEGEDTEASRLALPELETRAGMRSMEGLFGFSESSKGWSMGDLFERVAGLFARRAVAAE